MKRKQILDEVDEERERQDEQWGGPAHDRSHSLHDWTTYIQKQLERIQIAQAEPESRERLIKIAALAVAAMEALYDE